MYSPSSGFMAAVRKNDIDSMVDILNGETLSLRNQLASLQRELASEVGVHHNHAGELMAENAGLRQRIAELGRQIDEAGYYLGQASDKDENSNRAYNILKGYAQAED